MRLSQPFGRAIQMFALIAAATSPLQLNAIGPYVSRGRGEGLRGNKHSRHRVAMDKRAALKARNRRRMG